MHVVRALLETHYSSRENRVVQRQVYSVATWAYIPQAGHLHKIELTVDIITENTKQRCNCLFMHAHVCGVSLYMHTWMCGNTPNSRRDD